MSSPADAIRELLRTLADFPIAARPRYVKDDISELRRTFPDDADFAQALRAVAKRLRSLSFADGTALDHDLDGSLRMKFPSHVVQDSDLRIIFRATDSGIELRGFGHRHEPDSVYFRAATRRTTPPQRPTGRVKRPPE